MKRANIRPGDRMAPRQQQNWDWRAAANFIFGGAGGGLMFFAALTALAGGAVGPLLFVGMALIGLGLTCVWFEIGRPWRAMNVYRHIATSWMTREAVIAPLVFIAGALALLTGQIIFTLLAGVFGAAFVYSQARILSADKGIPAWRHSRCLPVVVATGFAEGAGLLALAAPLLAPNALVAIVLIAIVTLVLRVILWKQYLAALADEGAPDGSLKALNAVDGQFVMIGNVAPVLLLSLAALGLPGAVRDQ
jgi:phenylacetyl-CoA:acceptor oxidoreductase subunit 2